MESPLWHTTQKLTQHYKVITGKIWNEELKFIKLKCLILHNWNMTEFHYKTDKYINIYSSSEWASGNVIGLGVLGKGFLWSESDPTARAKPLFP